MVIFFGLGNHQIRLYQNTLQCYFTSFTFLIRQCWLLNCTSAFNPFTYYESPEKEIFDDDLDCAINEL